MFVDFVGFNTSFKTKFYANEANTNDNGERCS